MASVLDYLTQGGRIFSSSLKNRFANFKYEGNADDICCKVVKDCWNGRFFMTSTQNFTQFWTRDFGLCTFSLVKLKYNKEVHHTLRYALNRFKKFQKITTTITPGGKPFDFPKEAADSLPWLIHSIKISKFPYHSFKSFLNKEIRKYFITFINEETGLVKPDEHFSSMKDFAVRRSSCYSNSLVAMLAKDLQSMKLDNPFKRYDYPGLIKRHFWNGSYFYDDLRKKEYVAGDANIFPFLSGAITNEDMLKKSLHAIQEANLDIPFPLKYTNSREGVKFIWQEFFLYNYESDAIWMHFGPLYVKLVGSVDKDRADSYKEKYKELIEKHKNFMEVFTKEGKVYKTPFYYSDSGMLWAANYLTL